MQKRSWNEKSDHNHDPEHLVPVSFVDCVCIDKNRDGEVKDGKID